MSTEITCWLVPIRSDCLTWGREAVDVTDLVGMGTTRADIVDAALADGRLWQGQWRFIRIDSGRIDFISEPHIVKAETRLVREIVRT